MWRTYLTAGCCVNCIIQNCYTIKSIYRSDSIFQWPKLLFFETYCVFSVQGLDLVEEKIAIPHVPGVKREQFQLVPPDVSLYPSVFAYLANHTTPNSEDLGGDSCSDGTECTQVHAKSRIYNVCPFSVYCKYWCVAICTFMHSSQGQELNHILLL